MVRRLNSDRSKEIAAALWDQTAQAFFENGQISGKELIRKQETQAQAIQNQQIQNDLKEITSNISDSIKDTILSEQPDNVGGLYNQKEEIHLNQKILNFSDKKQNQSIKDSIKETQEHIAHVFKHEKQHAEHNDHEGLIIPQDGLLLGGVKLTATEFIEGINMSFTGTHSESGKQVVSLDYIRTHKKFQEALSKSGISLIEAQEALKNRNISILDDRFRIINRDAA